MPEQVRIGFYHVKPQSNRVRIRPHGNGQQLRLIENCSATDCFSVCTQNQPLPGIDVRVIRITDDTIPAWDDNLPVEGTGPASIGEIVVKGPVVTREYLNRPEKTALAKIADAGGEDTAGQVWHRMGDVGYFDDQGRLWFCGRKAHRVTPREGVLFPVTAETIFNRHPDVTRTALVGVGPQGQQRPILVVEPQPGRAPSSMLEKQRFTLELLALGAEYAHTQPVQDVLFYTGIFPTDVRHNAKIQREKLAVWAAKHLRESLKQKTAPVSTAQTETRIPRSRRIGDLFRAVSILLSVALSIVFLSRLRNRKIKKRIGESPNLKSKIENPE